MDRSGTASGEAAAGPFAPARRLLIVDSAVSAFGRHDHESAIDCASEVATAVVARHPQLAERVGLIAVGSARTGPIEGINSGLAQLVGERVGLPTVAGIEVHAFCASSNTALRTAATIIEAGRADAALVVGLDHLLAGPPGPLVPDAAQAEGRHGFSPPVFYALCAHRYLHETGAPREALASVAVHNRRLGSDNPAARYREPITVEEVLSSRMIAEPLTLLQCCPPADGAGALLVAAADAISGSPPPGAVRILGLGAASRDPDETSLTSFREDVDSARAAYEAAAVGPRDIDVAEVHDAFTISQVIHLEDLGIAARGEGWRHAVVGESRRPVVNPSGGLLSRGHPLGATGIAQFDSIRRYLSTPNGDGRDERRLGLVQQAGGLRALGQILSEVAVLGRLGA